MAYEDHAQQFTVLANKPETLLPEEPQVLLGEVKAGASHPDVEDAVSVTANLPGEALTPPAPEPLGEVEPGANTDDAQAPSVQGTTYEKE